MALKTVSDTITYNQLAELLGCETPEDRSNKVWEYVLDWDFSWARSEVKLGLGEKAYELLNAEEIEEKCQELIDKCIERECEEADRKYMSAIRHVGEKLFAEHNLVLIENEKKMSFLIRPYIPAVANEKHFRTQHGWTYAASAIIETINGVGMFGFSNPKELKDSGPYKSMKQAVLQHIHWIKEHPNVYEGTKASYLVERQLR
jgi:hypothetical protein